VKHASAAALTKLAPLLNDIRRNAALRERTHGVFYLKSRAFLHFHEDPTGLFADVKLDGTHFTRMRIVTRAEQREPVRVIDRALTSLHNLPAGGLH
jgi:hypothetical protein